MMKTPTISIIVPVYNTEQYLRPCLDSILAQNFADFEAILVDDGSTDQSGAICDGYAAKDCRIVVIHKQNEGVAKARITAFEHSKGELITFIDSDDYVGENYLLYLFDCITKYKVDVSCCQEIEVRYGVQKKIVRPEVGYFNKEAIEEMLTKDFLFSTEINKAGMPLFFWSKMIKRRYVGEMLKAGLGYWPLEDMVAIFLLMQQISSMYISEEAHYFYIRHESHATMISGLRRWETNIKVWERLLELDKNHYLQEQMPFRIKHHVAEHINDVYKNARSYKEFRENWECVFKNSLIRKYFMNYSFSIRNIPFRIVIWTLQHNRPFAYYSFMKCRGLMKSVGK